MSRTSRTNRPKKSPGAPRRYDSQRAFRKQVKPVSPAESARLLALLENSPSSIGASANAKVERRRISSSAFLDTETLGNMATGLSGIRLYNTRIHTHLYEHDFARAVSRSDRGSGHARGKLHDVRRASPEVLEGAMTAISIRRDYRTGEPPFYIVRAELEPNLTAEVRENNRDFLAAIGLKECIGNYADDVPVFGTLDLKKASILRDQAAEIFIPNETIIFDAAQIIRSDQAD